MQTPLKLVASVCLGFAALFAACGGNRQPSAASRKQVAYYVCPMHPQYRSDRPGKAPCCGMDLIPAYAGSEGSPSSTALAGAVQVSPTTQQIMGLRLAKAERAAASDRLRLFGRVAADESRLFRVVAAADGWIRSLGPNPPGSFVPKGQILGSYYTQGLQAAQQALLFAAANSSPSTRAEAIGSQGAPVPLNLQIAIDTLRSLGMNDLQINELRETRQHATEIRIYSPVSGFVLARNVSPEQRFDKGLELYRIADISRVWITADVFERDRPFVMPGATAVVRYSGREFRARVTDSLPQLDAQARTLKVRLEAENPHHLLQPDAFVDIELAVKMPEAITVVADAVIDTGLRKVVYVRLGDGSFEPRSVETGWRLGDRIQIQKGLEPGETTVIGGNFLIDSESRIRSGNAAAARVYSALEKDPVCGMDVDANAPNPIQARVDDKTYTFCSPRCRAEFVAARKAAPKQTARRGDKGAE